MDDVRYNFATINRQEAEALGRAGQRTFRVIVANQPGEEGGPGSQDEQGQAPGERLVDRAASPPARAGSRQGARRVVVARTRPAGITAALEQALAAELVPMGSAGAKAMAILQGRVDVYAHAGGQYQWDSAAPVAVAAAAGLHVSRLDGSPLIYNAADRALPDLLICRPEYASTVIDVANS
mgnify:CR=1 FL=1